MEVVLFIVGLAIGVAVGWFIWDRVGSKRLNEDFARRLRNTDDQIVSHRRRADAAEAEIEPLRAQIRELKDDRKDLQKQQEKLKGRFEKLKVEKEEVEASVAAVRAKADEAERLAGELEDSRRHLSAAQSEVEELRLQLASVDDLRARLVSAQDRLVEAERAKEDARLRAAEAEKVTERATVELEASMDTIATLREAAEGAIELQHRLDDAEQRVTELEATASRQTDEIAGLREQLAASTILADERATAGVEPEDIEVTEPASESDPSAEEQGGSEPAAEPVEHIAIDTEDDAAEGAVDRGTPVVADRPEAAMSESIDDRDAAVARVREIASRTSGGHDVGNDDLRKIHGIGPKIEKLLKSMGITSFLQVANLTPEDIEVVARALDAFPGRIERDDWVGSADQLYRDKYEND